MHVQVEMFCTFRSLWTPLDSCVLQVPNLWSPRTLCARGSSCHRYLWPERCQTLQCIRQLTVYQFAKRPRFHKTGSGRLASKAGRPGWMRHRFQRPKPFSHRPHWRPHPNPRSTSRCRFRRFCWSLRPHNISQLYFENIYNGFQWCQ